MPLWRGRRRFSRTLGYALVCACGVCSIIWPPASVREAASPLFAVAFVWSGLLAVGGLTCALSAARGGWEGEWVGLWPLMFALTVFAVAVASNGNGATSIAGAALLGGTASLMYARWTDVASLRYEALQAREARERAEREGRP